MEDHKEEKANSHRSEDSYTQCTSPEPTAKKLDPAKDLLTTDQKKEEGIVAHEEVVMRTEIAVAIQDTA